MNRLTASELSEGRAWLDLPTNTERLAALIDDDRTLTERFGSVAPDWADPYQGAFYDNLTDAGQVIFAVNEVAGAPGKPAAYYSMCRDGEQPEGFRPAQWAWMQEVPRDERLVLHNRRELARPGARVWAMIGCAPLMGVDIDDAAKVEDLRLAFEKRGVPIFAEVASGRPGGTHLYVQHNGDVKNGAGTGSWSGVDFKATGGLVFLPGSKREKHHGVAYSVVMDDVAFLHDHGYDARACSLMKKVRDSWSSAEARDVTPLPDEVVAAAAAGFAAYPEPVQAEDWDGEVPARGRELRDRFIMDDLRWLLTVPCADDRDDAGRPLGSGFGWSMAKVARSLRDWVAGTGLDESWAEGALLAVCASRFGQPDAADRATIKANFSARASAQPRDWPTPRSAAPAPAPRLAAPVEPPQSLLDAAPDWDEPFFAEAAAEEKPAGEATLAAAMAVRGEWVSPDMLAGGRSVRAIYAPGTHDHGLHLLVSRVTESEVDDGKGGTKIKKSKVSEFVRVTDYLVRRSECRIDEGNGGADYSYRCEVIGSAGRVWTTPWLSADDSTSPRRVVASSGARVSIPGSSGDDVLACRAALGVLAEAEMVVDRPLRRTGWGMDPDGVVEGPVFHGVTGSISADGVVAAPLAVLPRVVDGGAAGREVADRMGWDRISDRLPEMVAAMMAIAPSHPEVPGAALGLAALAPLRSSRMGSVGLIGQTDGGKSVTMKCVRSLYSDVTFGSLSWAVNLANDRVGGASVWGAWWHDCVLAADDMASGENVSARAGRDFVDAVLKLAMGSGDTSAKASSDGVTLQGALSWRSPVLMSAETAPTIPGVTNRLIHVTVEGPEAVDPTLDMSEGGGVIRFEDGWGDSGEARAVWGGYLAWLARQVRDSGPYAPGGTLESLARTSSARWSSEYTRLKGIFPVGTTRAVQIAASLSLGWIALRDYAASLGREGEVPSRAEVDGWLRSLVSETRDETGSTSAGQQILQWVAGQISAGRVKITDHRMREPRDSAVARALGWRWSGGSAPEVGFLSACEKYVVLTDACIQQVKASDRGALGQMPLQELRHRLDGLVPPGTKAREGSSRGQVLGMGNRASKRGYPIPIEMLEIDLAAARADDAVDWDARLAVDF